MPYCSTKRSGNRAVTDSTGNKSPDYAREGASYERDVVAYERSYPQPRRRRASERALVPASATDGATTLRSRRFVRSIMYIYSGLYTYLVADSAARAAANPPIETMSTTHIRRYLLRQSPRTDENSTQRAWDDPGRDPCTSRRSSGFESMVRPGRPVEASPITLPRGGADGCASCSTSGQRADHLGRARFEAHRDAGPCPYATFVRMQKAPYLHRQGTRVGAHAHATQRSAHRLHARPCHGPARPATASGTRGKGIVSHHSPCDNCIDVAPIAGSPLETGQANRHGVPRDAADLRCFLWAGCSVWARSCSFARNASCLAGPSQMQSVIDEQRVRIGSSAL